MGIENRFNLVGEPWIAVNTTASACSRLVSLADIFSDSSIFSLSGTPVRKVAILKLLIAIAQRAYTPNDDDDWLKMGVRGVQQQGAEYLQKWKERFYLFGDKPFLQMPQVKAAKIQPISATQPDKSSGNTPSFFDSEHSSDLTLEMKANLIVEQCGFALSGKKTDSSFSLSGEEKKSAKAGPLTGYCGYLHSYVLGDTLIDTIWLNILTKEDIESMDFFTYGVGIPPWEEMPATESCSIAQRLKSSFMGTLLPMSRFCLLADSRDELHYVEGLSYSNHLEGWRDPSISIDTTGKKAKVIFADTEKKPWRSLTSMLSFLSDNKSYYCLNLKHGHRVIQKAKKDMIIIYSGGLQVSSNAGEQYVSGTNDYVDSIFSIPANYIGTDWYDILKQEMGDLEHTAKMLWSCVNAYQKAISEDNRDKAGIAVNIFWQLCEPYAQELFNACGAKETIKIRKRFAGFANDAYNQSCPADTARQLSAWANNKPDLGKYLKGGKNGS